MCLITCCLLRSARSPRDPGQESVGVPVAAECGLWEHLSHRAGVLLLDPSSTHTRNEQRHTELRDFQGLVKQAGEPYWTVRILICVLEH